MRIVSFAWTTPALVAGQKTVTRREWDDKYAITFHNGDYVQAYNKSPRYGGKQVAVIQLTSDPYKEWSANCSDWHAEGFQYLTEKGLSLNGHSPKEILRDWKTNPRMLWVIRFKLVHLVAPIRKHNE